jgi:hypothetical protein
MRAGRGSPGTGAACDGAAGPEEERGGGGVGRFARTSTALCRACSSSARCAITFTRPSVISHAAVGGGRWSAWRRRHTRWGASVRGRGIMIRTEDTTARNTEEYQSFLPVNSLISRADLGHLGRECLLQARRRLHQPGGLHLVAGVAHRLLGRERRLQSGRSERVCACQSAERASVSVG